VHVDDPSFDSGAADLVGERLLDRYDVEEQIGRGGMSVVYRGRDVRLERPVCIKAFYGIHPALPAYRTVYQHFVQEAFALSQLRHPNTLRIYDFGYLPLLGATEAASNVEGGTPFQVSEYLDGGTLEDLVRRRSALTVEEVWRVVEPVAGALSEAHQAGIVHRDLKPSNILFTRVGDVTMVKLADFGVAKACAETAMVPHRAPDPEAGAGDPVFFYSLGWAAPEQLAGSSVAPSADVYSLGLLTAYMLAGRAVYPDDDVLRAFALRSEGDAGLERQLASLALPPGLDRLILSACRAVPAERLSTASAFLDELEPVLFPDAGLDEVTDVDDTELEELPPSSVVLRSLDVAEIVAAGRRVRPVVMTSPLTIGPALAIGKEGTVQGAVVESSAHLRVTLLPGGKTSRVHIKGLNCFVERPKSRPSPAVDLQGDEVLTLRSLDGRTLDAVRVSFGRPVEGGVLVKGEGVDIMIPSGTARHAYALDFGVRRELVLLYVPSGASR
jgi:serine/threonine-protein kinase